MNGGAYTLVPTARFERAYHRYIGSDEERLAHVEAALERLRLDPRDPKLKTHALRGVLRGSFACSCGYDCRIVFTFEKDPQTGRELIALHNLGTHDEVY